MQTLWQDLRYGARMLLKQPGFTLIAVLTLALGIGANTAIFSVVSAILLRPLPYEQPEQLVKLYAANVRRGVGDLPFSFPDYADWRTHNQSFAEMAAYFEGPFNLAGGDQPERLKGATISASLFPLLGVKPMLGRNFLDEEDRPDVSRVVIISHSLWQRRFGSDPNLIGKTVMIDGRNAPVVGIMPPGFGFPERTEVWVPLAESATTANRGGRGLEGIARLKSSVTLGQARAEMIGIAARLAEQYPNSNNGWGVTVVSFYDDLVGETRTQLLLLLGAVGFVLLIACANVANLLLAHGAARWKEIAVRLALGASRWRVARQLLTESLLLSLLGSGLGLLLAVWGVDLLIAAMPERLPFWVRISLDWRVLLFLLGTSLLTAIVCGLAPALQTSNQNLNQALKEGGRSATAGAARHGLRGALIVAEMALAVMLLIGAGLAVRSFLKLYQVYPGFNAANVLNAEIALNEAQHPARPQQLNFYRQLVERMEALPGIESVSIISNLPLGGKNRSQGFSVEGRPAPEAAQTPRANTRVIGPNYFRTMGIPLLKGREFTPADNETAERVAIIDELMAHDYFPNEDPLGKRIKFGRPDSSEPWMKIIGVAGDVKHYDLTGERQPLAGIYTPHEQTFTARGSINMTMTLVVRTEVEPLSLAGALRREVAALDRTLPLSAVSSMEQVVAQAIGEPRYFGALFSLFAAVALTMAAVGLYGVMSYVVSQRTQEIGIRMAFGAQTADVLMMVIKQGMNLAGIGLAIGLIVAAAMTRLMERLLFGVSATDPLTFAVIAPLLTAVALLACYLPARRATKVDPMVALRCE
jgi:putative ABC transport system permease protein